MECWASILRHNEDGRAVSSTRLPHFTPKGIRWYSFVSEAEWTAGLQNADTVTSFEHFQGPRREYNHGPPVLWRMYLVC